MKMRKKFQSRFILAIALFLIAISLFNFISAESSTSVYNVQYTNPFGSTYSSLMSGAGARDSSLTSQSEEFFDMQVYIPPAGCQPYVVRSDLLEEQNVPVFCQLVPVKINPGVDITRIDRISIVQKDNNPYIAGIGFHPARAAIQSKNELVSSPYTDNIGYVVVVLKRQETEKSMPEFINVTLAATMNYGTKGGFGIGDSEFYLPVLTDDEFSSRLVESSFFNGMGYLRAESLDEKSAVISIYTSDNRKVFSQRIEKGKVSGDYYLPTNTGGQGIRISLQDITLPQIKAKVKVNDQTFEVYNGARFYNNKCSINNIISYGDSTGKATINCGSSISLEKKFNKASLIISGSGTSTDYSVGDLITSDTTSNFYFAYLGKIPFTNDYYIYVVMIPRRDIANLKPETLDKKIKSITRDLASQTKDKTEKELQAINNVGGYVVKFTKQDDSPIAGITFAGSKASDINIAPNALTYFKRALDAYDGLKNKFGTEKYSADKTYGEEALWREYKLAVELGQASQAQTILSRIENEYPQSTNNGRTAKEIYDAEGIFSAEDSTYYDEKNNLFVELVSISEPSESEASANLIYSPTTGNPNAIKTYKKGDYIDDGLTSDKTLTLTDFDKEKVTISYSCKKGSDIVSNKIVSSGNFLIPDCDNVRINVMEINLEKVAKVKLTPITTGRSRETNFTFSIGIEKRAKALQLSPQAANKKIKELNEQIAKWRNITQKLGKLIETEKAACLATSAILNVKNLFSGMLSKDASARREVMERWNTLCSSAEFRSSEGRNYANAEDCIAGEYDSKIKNEISALASIQETINKDAKSTTDFKAQVESFKTYFNGKSDIKLLDSSGKEVTKAENKDFGTIVNGFIATDGKTILISQSELTSLKKNYMIIEKGSAGGFSEEAINNSKKEAYDILKKVAAIQKESAPSNSPSGILLSSPLQPSGNLLYSYLGLKWNNQYTLDSGIIITDETPIAVTRDNLFVLQKSSASDGKTYQVTEVYKIGKDGKTLSAFGDVDKAEKEKLQLYVFKEKIIYNNKCHNCNYMKVFTTEPYRGLPSLLPFDDVQGWYVKTEQLFPGLGTGNQKTFADSGEVNSFYLCNVGENGLIDSAGDICRRFDRYTGDTLNSFGDLSAIESQEIVTRALKAIKQAESLLKSNPSATNIKIDGISKDNGNNGLLKVQDAVKDYGSKCTDFMSPKECQLIFNVCDPVVCPNDRCDFGGKYPVDNVIQSGIVGSTMLCLPNFIGFHPKTGVIIPVCLTGLHAGIDYWASIMESYRDCLNESVTTGKTTGICDAIQSVYVCDFFWRQAGPFTNAIFKNLFVYAFGQDEMRGGGEYMFVNDAWANAQKSWSFFTNDYLKGSKLAFGAKSISEIGSDVCKMSMSASYPDNFKSSLEPESPVQYNAFFEEIPYTDATVPATSQYKVSYHIYAGNEQGHYYSVYLKSAPTAIGYSGKDTSIVASGYVPKGEQVSESKDSIDVSGFKELCIRIDAQDKCGFKSVTTGAMINYLKQETAGDAANSKADSDSECIAGSRNAGALLTPNIQQGVEELVNPELYNQGIIRVCASVNPGNGVDDKRWTPAGKCSDKGVLCWLDTNSVKKTITAKGLLNETLSEAEKAREDALKAQDGYFDEKGASEKIAKIKGDYVSEENINKLAEKISGVSPLGDDKLNLLPDAISEVIAKFIFTKQKAELAFYEARVYDAVARFYEKSVKVEEKKGDVNIILPTSSEKSSGEESSSASGTAQTSSVSGTQQLILEYVQGNLLSTNIYFKFENNAWKWSSNPDKYWKSLNDLAEPGLLASLDSQDKNLIQGLDKKNQIEGIKYLLDSVSSNKFKGPIGDDKLQTPNIVYDTNKIFTLNKDDEKLYLKFVSKWYWGSDEKDWFPITSLSSGAVKTSFKELIAGLYALNENEPYSSTTSFNEGLVKILSFN